MLIDNIDVAITIKYILSIYKKNKFLTLKSS